MDRPRHKRRCISYDMAEILPVINRDIIIYLEENVHGSYLYKEEGKSIIPGIVILALLTKGYKGLSSDDFEIYKKKIEDYYPEYSNYVRYFEKWSNALHMYLEENVNSHIKTGFLVQGILDLLDRELLSPRSLKF